MPVKPALERSKFDVIKNIKEIFGRKFAYLAEHLKTQFEYTQLIWSTNLISHIIRFRISLNKVNLFPRFDFQIPFNFGNFIRN